jgi:hypothetical protein
MESEFLKGRIIKSCLFIAAFEILKYNIEENIKKFFCYEVDESNSLIENDNYKKEVYSKYSDGKIIRNRFDGSLQWYHLNNALCNEDLTNIKKLKKFRNNLAHNTLEILMNDKEYYIEEKIDSCSKYLNKIEKWWYVEVYSDNKETHDVDFKSGSVVAIELLKQVSNE